jgi:hypothetical protein
MNKNKKINKGNKRQAVEGPMTAAPFGLDIMKVQFTATTEILGIPFNIHTKRVKLKLVSEVTHVKSDASEKMLDEYSVNNFQLLQHQLVTQYPGTTTSLEMKSSLLNETQHYSVKNLAVAEDNQSIELTIKRAKILTDKMGGLHISETNDFLQNNPCNFTLTLTVPRQLPIEVTSRQASYNAKSNRLTFKYEIGGPIRIDVRCIGYPFCDYVRNHVVVKAKDEKGFKLAKVREINSVTLKSNGDTEVTFSVLPTSKSKKSSALELIYGKEFDSGMYENVTIKSFNPIADKKARILLLNALKSAETPLTMETLATDSIAIVAHIPEAKAAIAIDVQPGENLDSGLATFQFALRESNDDVFVHFTEEKELIRAKHSAHLNQVKALLDQERDGFADAEKGLRIEMKINNESAPRVARLLGLRKSGNYEQNKTWIGKGIIDTFSVRDLVFRIILQGSITMGV